MKKLAFLMLILILMLPLFSQIRNVHATSSGYERYQDNYCEVYVEYFPIVPFDPAYPTASEEFAIKFYVIQQSWWSGICKYWPDGFIVAVYFRDDTCGNISYTTWKRWYPTSTSQSGWYVSWSLSGGYGPLTIGATISTPDSWFQANYTKYPEINPPDGKEYMHLSDLLVDYNDNLFWDSTYTEGAGSIGVPNAVAQAHEGHHTLIAIWFGLVWNRLWAEWPSKVEWVYFRIGDDIPADTDCWLTVEQGDTAFSDGTGSPSPPPSGGGGGLCPTLFVWNGTGYVEEGLLNIHADSDVTVQHRIQSTLALENGFYKLQLRELDNFTSHIDQVKLYAIDDKGEWHLCPLTYAYHSSLGKVKQTLLLDDSNRVDLKPTETIDLKFAPSIAYSETAYFIFEINGYNRKTEE